MFWLHYIIIYLRLLRNVCFHLSCTDCWHHLTETFALFYASRPLVKILWSCVNNMQRNRKCKSKKNSGWWKEYISIKSLNSILTCSPAMQSCNHTWRYSGPVSQIHPQTMMRILNEHTCGGLNYAGDCIHITAKMQLRICWLLLELYFLLLSFSKQSSNVQIVCWVFLPPKRFVCGTQTVSFLTHSKLPAIL